MRSNGKWESAFDEAVVATTHAYQRYCYRFGAEGEFKEIAAEMVNEVKHGHVRKETKAYRYVEAGDKLFVCSKADKKIHILTVLTTKMTYKVKRLVDRDWQTLRKNGS
jgi:hypothetical protein